jgi:hypothetical protein
VSDFTPPPQYAEYPRGTAQPSGEFDRPPGVYFDAIGDAWTLVRRDIGTWISLVLVAFLLATIIAMPFQVIGTVLQGTGGGFNPASSGPFDVAAFSLSMVLNLLGGAVGFPVYAGLYNAAIKQIRGEQITINDLFKGFSHFLPLAIYGLLYNLLIAIGCALCLFPGVFAIGVLSPGALLIMDRNMGPVQAISESLKTMGNQSWMLGLFVIVAGIAMSVLGTLMCCVGLLVTMPVYFVAIALHYNYFWKKEPEVYQTPAY